MIDDFLATITKLQWFIPTSFFSSALPSLNFRKKGFLFLFLSLGKFFCSGGSSGGGAGDPGLPLILGEKKRGLKEEKPAKQVR